MRGKATINGRPVMIASYEPEPFTDDLYQEETPESSSPAVVSPALPMRRNFPPAGTSYQGGESDGYEYRTVFGGSKLEATYDMVRGFLREEGYGELPLPRDAEELLRFRLPVRRGQILLFEDNGYVHNPIKILFPDDRRKKTTLILCIYNEAFPDHLLRFHRRQL